MLNFFAAFSPSKPKENTVEKKKSIYENMLTGSQSFVNDFSSHLSKLFVEFFCCFFPFKTKGKYYYYLCIAYTKGVIAIK